MANSINSARNAAQFPNGSSLPIEIIVSDGGSKDKTRQIADNLADKVINTRIPSRPLQLNEGARISRGNILLFLHADTILPEGGIIRLAEKMRDYQIAGGGFKKKWNWNPSIQVSCFIKKAMWFWKSTGNWLVKTFKTFPGDNAIFIRKSIFEQIKGYRNLWICEDFDTMLRLKKFCKKKPCKITLIGSSVLTSTRRIEKYGFFRTLFIWILIYFAWRFGMNPYRLRVLFKNYSTLPQSESNSYIRF